MAPTILVAKVMIARDAGLDSQGPDFDGECANSFGEYDGDDSSIRLAHHARIPTHVISPSFVNFAWDEGAVLTLTAGTVSGEETIVTGRDDLDL